MPFLSMDEPRSTNHRSGQKQFFGSIGIFLGIGLLLMLPQIAFHTFYSMHEADKKQLWNLLVDQPVIGEGPLPSAKTRPPDPQSIAQNVTASPSLLHSDHETLAPESPRNVSIFYNIYMPPTDQERVLAIIAEQLESRRASPLVNATLYYTLIGDVNFTMIDCAPCEPIGTYPEGGENITLQALFTHCFSHPSNLVAYIHNKGSFSPKIENDNLRRVLTKAVFSNQCASMPMDSTCDTCSALFSPWPKPHNSGNMFVAECSYVRQLLSPLQFSQSKEALAREVLALKNTSFFRNNFKTVEKPGFAGTGRYASEQWVHSHPMLRPCDVFPGTGFLYSTAPSNTTWIPHRQSAPRPTRSPLDFEVHQWYKLRGRLLEYNYHYGMQPGKESWVWQYYTNVLQESKSEMEIDIPDIKNQSFQKEHSGYHQLKKFFGWSS